MRAEDVGRCEVMSDLGKDSDCDGHARLKEKVYEANT